MEILELAHRKHMCIESLMYCKQVVIRYKEAEGEDVTRFGSGGLPVVIVASRDGKEEVLDNTGKSRDEVREAIKKKLGLNPRMLLSGKFMDENISRISSSMSVEYLTQVVTPGGIQRGGEELLQAY